MMNKLAPIHPGEVLFEDFLSPLGLSASRFAAALGVPTNRITRIINGQTSVTADSALRLSKALGTTPELWLNLQQRFDLETAKDNPPQLDNIPLMTAVA